MVDVGLGTHICGKRLAERLDGCAYDVSSRCWVPAEHIAGIGRARKHCLLHGFKYQVEKARIGKSVCRRCGDQIQQFSIRVGYPAAKEKGFLGVEVKKRKLGQDVPLVTWLHVACARGQIELVEACKKGRKELTDRLLGFDALKRVEQEQLLKDLLEKDEGAEDSSEKAMLPVLAPRKELPPHDPPIGFKPSVVMLPWQAEGLGWMLGREEDVDVPGGILADEMGMGKTICCIALILGRLRGPTLIVCPSVMLEQWETEIRRFTLPGALNVQRYYGDRASRVLPEGSTQMPGLVVLTTYRTLESEYRREVNRHKVKCVHCKKLMFKASLERHRRYHCSARRSGCRVDFVEDSELDGGLGGRTASFVSARRDNTCANVDKRELRSPGTSESALVLAVPPPEPPSEFDFAGSPLLSFTWGRVVLDEAHRIKGRVNSTAQAAFELKAITGRWCLTGTPIQNRVSELHAMIRFLNYFPYAHYFCKKSGCTCASMRYCIDPATSLCLRCGHAKGQHHSYFNTTILGPIQRCGFRGKGKAAVEALRGQILDRILLRRTKAERQAEIKLEPLTFRIRCVQLSEAERDFYDSLHAQSATRFNTYVKEGTVLRNFANVLVLIMRLRQAADDPYLVSHSLAMAAYKTEASERPPAGSALQGFWEPDQTWHPCTLRRWRSSGLPQVLWTQDGTASTLPLEHIRLHRDSADHPAPIKRRRVVPQAAMDVVDCEARVSRHEEEWRLAKASQAAPAAVAAPVVPKRAVCGLCLDVFEDASEIHLRQNAPCGCVFHRDCLGQYDEEGPVEISSDFCPTCGAVWKRSALASCFERDGGTGVEDLEDSECMWPQLEWAADVSEPVAPELATAIADSEARAARYEEEWRLVKSAKSDASGAAAAPVVPKRVCGLCLGVLRDERESNLIHVAICGCFFHQHCIGQYKDLGPVGNADVCPACGAVSASVGGSEFESSSKVVALIEELRLMQTTSHSSKAIVFSQFVSMLERIFISLQKDGISVAMLSGAQSLSQRSQTLRAFQEQAASPKVLLISLMAGGEGLNLQAADHVFLLDPWWNPAVEMQAVQRAHRLGQTRRVRVVRLVSSGTIEEKIIALQKQKQLTFDFTVGNSNAALQKLTADDLAFLFG